MKKLEANIKYKTKKFKSCKHLSNKISHSSWWTVRQEIQTSWLTGRVVEFYNAGNAFVRLWINLFLYLCLCRLNIILGFCYYYCLGFLFVCFWEIFSLYTSECLGTCSADSSGLELVLILCLYLPNARNTG